jgi:hypothetical protein
LIQIYQDGGVNMLSQAVRKGIADGSIRSDLDPDLTGAAIGNLISALVARFSLLGQLISEEYGLPWMSISQEIIQAFLRGIQSPASS